jgi:hypothetical protein
VSTQRMIAMRVPPAVALLLLTFAAGVWAANLLPNPGFERGELNGPPVGWLGQGVTASINGSLKLVPLAHQGRMCLRVDCKSETGIYGAFCQPVDLDCPDGGRLLLTGWYRTEGKPTPELSLVTFAEDFRAREWATTPLQAEAQGIAETLKWKQFSWNFECLPGTRQAVVVVRLNGSGALMLDDVSLIRYPGDVACTVEAPGLVSSLPDGRQCVLRLTGLSDAARRVVATVTPFTDKRTFKPISKTVDVRRDAATEVRLGYAFDFRQQLDALVTVTSEDQSEVYECRELHVPALIEARVTAPAFRGALLGSVPGTDVVIAGMVNAASDLQQATAVDVSIPGSDLEAVLKRDGPSEGRFTATLDGARLLSGAYKVRVRGQTKGQQFSLELPISRVTPANNEVATDARGRLLANGRPVLVRGIFDATEPHDLDVVAKAEFNTVVVPYRRASSEMLKKAADLGLMALVSGQDPDPEFWARQEERLGAFSSLLGWYHPVEDSRGVRVPAAAARSFYAQITSSIRRRPFITAMRSASMPEEYAGAGDITAAWVAPRAGTDARVITRMIDAAVGAAGSKPVWAVVDLSGLYWYSPTGQDVAGAPVRPNAAEARAMTYLSLIHGAKGLLYYAYWVPQYRSTSEWLVQRDDPKLWAALAALNTELQWLESPILEGSRTLLDPLAGGMVHVALFDSAAGRYLIAANITDHDVMVSFTPPTKSDKLTVMFEERELAAAGPGTFADSFGPHGVHIYELR